MVVLNKRNVVAVHFDLAIVVVSALAGCPGALFVSTRVSLLLSDFLHSVCPKQQGTGRKSIA